MCDKPIVMSRFRFLCCLAPFIIASSTQPVWGAVLAHPSGLAKGADTPHGDSFPAAAACCDQQPDENKVEDKIIVAQIFDIVTGAAKLLYNATDDTKEREAAAKAAELQKQQDERAQAEARQNAQRAIDADEQRRARLSDPFAVSNDSFAVDRPAYDARKGPSNGVGGSLVNSSQVNISAMPANSALPLPLPTAVMDLPGQVSVPTSQIAAPVGSIIISMDQEQPAANASGTQEAQANIQQPPPNAAPVATTNGGNTKDVPGGHPAQAEKAPAPPVKKSDNPFDN